MLPLTYNPPNEQRSRPPHPAAHRLSLTLAVAQPVALPAPPVQLDVREVYEAHFRYVWMSLRRLGVAESDAADATQEVFLVVHRRLATFEGRSALTTWLFGICVRVARDRRRAAQNRRETVAESLHLEGLATDEASAEENVSASQARALLDGILEQMTPSLRVVFVMFELEGLDGETIAEILQVPVGTVRSRMRLARESFQRCVDRLRAREERHG